MPENLETVLGYQMTHGEFLILLEALKGILFAIIAGFAMYLFNLSVKTRETNLILLNDIIKPRILKLHTLNESFLVIISEYLNILDGIIGSRNTTAVSTEEFIREQNDAYRSNKIDSALRLFRDSLPEKLNNLILNLASARYILGEQQYIIFNRRINIFNDEVKRVWSKYASGIDQKLLTRAIEDHEYGNQFILQELSRKLMFVRIAQRRMIRLLKSMFDDFDRVARTKGVSEIFRVLPTPTEANDGLSAALRKANLGLEQSFQKQAARLELEMFPKRPLGDRIRDMLSIIIPRI